MGRWHHCPPDSDVVKAAGCSDALWGLPAAAWGSSVELDLAWEGNLSQLQAALLSDHCLVQLLSTSCHSAGSPGVGQPGHMGWARADGILLQGIGAEVGARILQTPTALVCHVVGSLSFLPTFALALAHL